MTGYRAQSADTSEEIDRIMIEHYRALGPEGRLHLACELGRAADLVATSGIRSRHPGATEEEVRMRLLALKHGPELTISFFGWDPAIRGW